MAPIEKILDDLRHKNRKAFVFFGNTVRQRRTYKERYFNYHFALTGHPLNAFTEDWDGGVNSMYFETFTYKSFFPKINSDIKHINKVDPVTACMKLKREWNIGCCRLQQEVSK